MTSEKLGIDSESETFGPKNSSTYYVSIPHTGQMSLISGNNMLPQVLNNNHQKKKLIVIGIYCTLFKLQLIDC